MSLPLKRTSPVKSACLALMLATVCVPAARAAEFALTAPETRKVANGGIVIRADLDGERRGTVRAALRIKAPPAVVFATMTSCAAALQYVPHLRTCRVTNTAADHSWQTIEQRLDLGWYSPSVQYVFRADFVPGKSIAFRQVSGDFKSNEGVWELEPAQDGEHTLLRYRVSIDPPAFVPSWLARSTFKRELPQMLGGLRLRCEAEQRTHARLAGVAH